MKITTEITNPTESRTSRYFDFSKEKGVFKLDRSVYTDPDLFELEMRYIFEGNWIYLGHESQVPKPGDYFSTTMGTQKVFLIRDRNEQIHALLNACPHRGATLCREAKGNKKYLTCTYHGWVFDLDGKLLQAQRESEFGPSFDKTANALPRVARFENYRGFLFGSLNPNVPPLEDHLKGVKLIIDMLVDQSPEGKWEVLKGYNACTYKGNWKLMIENGGGDGLHVGPTHGNLMKIVQWKARDKAGPQSVDFSTFASPGQNKPGGLYALGNGHTLILQDFPDPSTRPSYFSFYPELVKKFGEKKAQWMCARFRQTCIYPNVFLMDQLATLIRYVRPIAVDKTEISFWCIAPVGEPDIARETRLRQFEEFFMASGMGTTDDNEEFQAVQEGSSCRSSRWSNLSFGMSQMHWGPDEEAAAMGLGVEHCGIFGYEGASLAQFQRWRELLDQGIASACHFDEAKTIG